MSPFEVMPVDRPAACHRLGEQLELRLLLKRGLAIHGSHKINNVLGQAFLAKRMGKTRLVAETGAGQHGVASATAAALRYGDARCTGAVDVDASLSMSSECGYLARRSKRCSLGRTLDDAVNEAMRDGYRRQYHTAWAR